MCATGTTPEKLRIIAADKQEAAHRATLLKIVKQFDQMADQLEPVIHGRKERPARF